MFQVRSTNLRSIEFAHRDPNVQQRDFYTEQKFITSHCSSLAISTKRSLHVALWSLGKNFDRSFLCDDRRINIKNKNTIPRRRRTKVEQQYRVLGKKLIWNFYIFFINY